MENKILNKEELRDMALDFIRNGDYNNAVKYLLMAIEETYDIDMSDVTFSTFEKVKDVIKYIKENI